MRTRLARGIMRGVASAPSTAGTEIMSRSSDGPDSAAPCSVFRRSASAIVVVRPRAMSVVT